MKTSVLSVLGLAVAINGQYAYEPVVSSSAAHTTTTSAAYGYSSATPVYSTTSAGGYEYSTSEAASSTGPVKESTKYETTLATVTSCPPYVTDCPASHKPTSSPVAVPYTTSTIKITKEYTITSCAPTVTNCPVGAVTTTVIESTTVCPVSEATSVPYTHPVESTKPYSPPAASSHGGQSSPAPPAETYPVQTYPAPAETHPAGPVLSTLTISTCVPTVITSVITVTGQPTPAVPVTTAKAPYGTAAPSGYTVPPRNNGTIEFTNSASSQRAGGLLVAALGLAAALL